MAQQLNLSLWLGTHLSEYEFPDPSKGQEFQDLHQLYRLLQSQEHKNIRFRGRKRSLADAVYSLERSLPRLFPERKGEIHSQNEQQILRIGIAALKKRLGQISTST